MPFSPEDVQANRDFFRAKVRAERQWIDVARRLKGEPSAAGATWVLADVRGRDAFAKAHMQGAICLAVDEIATIAPLLPKDREIVTYCWNDT
jgi:rhodanese-related sulfurtransferase